MTFEGIAFEHAAWSLPRQGFVDLQDGIYLAADGADSSPVPGALDCTNCSGVAVRNCSFARMGATAVSFAGVAQRNAVEACRIDDTSCSAVQVLDLGAPNATSWNNTGVRAPYLPAPFIAQWGRTRLCVLDRRYAETCIGGDTSFTKSRKMPCHF